MGTILEIRDLYVEFHSDEHIVNVIKFARKTLDHL